LLGEHRASGIKWAKVVTKHGHEGFLQSKFLMLVTCKRPAVDAACSSAEVRHGRSVNMWLLQANLRGSNAKDDKAGNGWKVRVAGIAQYIKEKRFAIINMQECNGGMEQDMLKHLAGTAYRHCPNCTQRNRVLYDSRRLKLVSEDYQQILGERKVYPRMKGYESRTLELCQFEAIEVGGARLRVGCTHLHHKTNGARSARVLAGLIEDGSPTTIISGDFNAKKKGSTSSDKHGESYAICSRAGWQDAVRDAPDQDLVRSLANLSICQSQAVPAATSIGSSTATAGG